MHFFMFALIIIFFVASISTNILTEKKENDLKKTILGAKIQDQGYVNEEKYSTITGASQEIGDHRIEKEMLIKVLQRTCVHLYVKAKVNNCDDIRNPQTVWGFVGNNGERGDLITAWEGSTIPKFSCSKMDRYGRYLIQEAIPISILQDKGYMYDFLDMDGLARNDPCGYGEFIDRDN